MNNTYSGSNEFIAESVRAINHLIIYEAISNAEYKVVTKLVNDNSVKVDLEEIPINERPSGTSYGPAKWHPKQGTFVKDAKTGKIGIQSPAGTLGHELAHQFELLYPGVLTEDVPVGATIQQINDSEEKSITSPFGNSSEEAAITKWENPYYEYHGQPTRNNHEIFGFIEVADFTSTTPSFMSVTSVIRSAISLATKTAPIREAYRSVRLLCFAEGTKILMGDGRNLNIEDVKLGDEILNYNQALDKMEKDTVTKIDKVIHSNIVKIKFSNGVENTNTDDHPYLVNGKGWCSFSPEETKMKYGIECSQLQIGDKCFSFDKSNNNLILVGLIAVTKSNIPIETYNLTGLKKNENYFANGILVSNESLKIK